MNDTTIPPQTAPPGDTDTLGADLIDQIERWLTDPHRTAHQLVTTPTTDLMATALAELTPPAATAATPELPRGLWRVLPDRLLTLHPARRGEGVARLRITTADHLELTALILDRWGWAQTGRHLRTADGRRCILGAQYTVYRLGYGTQDTATTAGAHIQAVLRARGIALPYPQWNEQPHVTADQALTVVRAAARAAGLSGSPAAVASPG